MMDTKEALEILEHYTIVGYPMMPGQPQDLKSALAHLTAMAEDYERVEAEVERLRGDALLFRDSVSQLTDYAKFEREAKEKAEAELEKVKAENERLIAVISHMNESALKAEAELARWRPLIEAAEKARKSTLTDDRVFWGVDEDAILLAALKCKEGK